MSKYRLVGSRPCWVNEPGRERRRVIPGETAEFDVLPLIFKDTFVLVEPEIEIPIHIPLLGD